MINKGLLKQIVLKVILVLIAFFSLNINGKASSFAYNAFDWDKFYNENKDYWTDFCAASTDGLSEEECLEISLSGKKEYYVSLYKILAKYERKGYKLDDNIIHATTFYYLTPTTFSDMPDEYIKAYRNGSAYGLDGDADTYDVDSDFSKEYFEGEVDTIKMLTKHMFSYPADCVGSVGTPVVLDDGSKYCSQGTLKGNDCVGTLATYHLNYTEKLIAQWGIFGKFFGLKDKYREECEAQGGKYSFTNKKQIDYDTYWRFLEESEYFDYKVHLNSQYASVLEETNHKFMSELTEEEKETYEDDIKKVRKRIVKEIKSVIESYGKFAETPNSFNNAGCTGGNAWWPIGSGDTTEDNGILFAKADPSSITVTSEFGPRKHPITGENKQHTGIDIGDVVEGVTNIIAVKDGVVVYPTDGAQTSCPSSTSMDDCGGGYGNYVVIQHNDGTYSLYAHLYQDSITVKANDSVKQGQVIGKVGSSGNSTGPHLHFEIRQGSNSSSSTVDPLTHISAESPRSSGGSCGGAGSELTKMLHWFEYSCNAKTNGGNYVVVNDGANIPTAGYGVALKYNVDRFKQYGVDVSGMSFGSEIAIDIVDAVEVDFLNNSRSNILNTLAQNGISLAEHQIDALVCRMYNTGNITNFPKNYLQYGDTDALYTNYMSKPVTGQGVGYMAGLETRRKAEWKLFHEGEYTYGDNC